LVELVWLFLSFSFGVAVDLFLLAGSARFLLPTDVLAAGSKPDADGVLVLEGTGGSARYKRFGGGFTSNRSWLGDVLLEKTVRLSSTSSSAAQIASKMYSQSWDFNGCR
jgi:hypothetical protein